MAATEGDYLYGLRERMRMSVHEETEASYLTLTDRITRSGTAQLAC